MPFDSNPLLAPQAPAGPDLAAAAGAAAAFASPHPYLLFRPAALSRIRRMAARSAKLQARFDRCLRPPEAWATASHGRAAIKARSRRLITTSFVALVAAGPRRDRGLAASRAALRQFAAASSWKERPAIRSFLDCAEIAAAVALAYDWLYDFLPADEQAAIERAILRNALEPAAAAYRDTSALWPNRRDNCALVSNGGIALAALAMLVPYRELASGLVQSSLVSAWNAFAAFAPDGAWAEGLSYWSLAARYAGLLVAALESTLGTSFGLADRPGLAQTGDFALHAAGPFGAAFDFADSERRFDVAPLLWLAHRFRRPVDSWLLGDYDGWCLPFQMIWPGRPRASPTALDLPTGKVFRGNDLACFRNTWRRHRRARPVFVAIKGGNPPAAEAVPSRRSDAVILHTQADAGTFVIDGAHHRWAIDLGPDDYDLPGYFDHGASDRDGQRWQYYRNQAAGHNTLVIDGRNQVPDVRAAILDSNVDGACKWVVFDLSAAYGERPGAVRRGAALIGRQVVIVDEVDPAVAGNIVWTMHFSAEPIGVSGPVARFRLGDDHFVARILEPDDAVFELAAPPGPGSFTVADRRQLHDRSLPPSGILEIPELPRRDDDGARRAAGAPIRRLQAVWPEAARRMVVLLLPDCRDDGDAPPPVPPLDHWLRQRTFRPVRDSRKLARTGRGGRTKYPGKVADINRYPSENLVGAADHV